MSKVKPDLKVVYRGRLNKDLDVAIRTAITSLGYKEYASGYNHIDDERDLAFDKVE